MHSSNRQARNKNSTHRRKIAMFVEIQDISQNNVIKGAQQHVPYAREEVTWQKLVEVLGKQKNLKEKTTCSLILFQLFRKSFARREQWLKIFKLFNRGHWLYRSHHKSK
jgi:hypothetical protein